MRAAPGLDPDDALGRQRVVAHEELRILFGVDVIGDDRKLVALAQLPAKRQRERGLARANRATDSDSQRLCHGHDLQEPTNGTIECTASRAATTPAQGRARRS